MKKVATKLKDNLSEQLNLYKYMDHLTLEKKELIIKGKVEELAELDRHIESVTCQILELEQNRLLLLETDSSKDTKLSDFIKKLDKESAVVLTDLRTQLIAVMDRIQKVNTINIDLIDNSIKWIEHSVTTIANIIAPESASYNYRGKALTNSPYNLNASGIVERDV
jgi:flagellar biosynthesis/type III secretory pathway chaperone